MYDTICNNLVQVCAFIEIPFNFITYYYTLIVIESAN